MLCVQVMIFDYDVHHGNGTHDIFYGDPDILFISTHQQGSYPGTGKLTEVGTGAGQHTTINLPLPGAVSRASCAHLEVCLLGADTGSKAISSNGSGGNPLG